MSITFSPILYLQTPISFILNSWFIMFLCIFIFWSGNFNINEFLVLFFIFVRFLFVFLVFGVGFRSFGLRLFLYDLLLFVLFRLLWFNPLIRIYSELLNFHFWRRLLIISWRFSVSFWGKITTFYSFGTWLSNLWMAVVSGKISFGTCVISWIW